jgi:hypothetical protein
VNIWDRGIHAIKFRLGAGKTVIVVIPVHMKSNVGGVNKRKAQRAKEAAFVIAEISKLQTTFNDSEFMILGDTNVLSGDESAVKTFVDAVFMDLNETDVPTTYSGPAPFDNIFLFKARPEFPEPSFWVIEPSDPQAQKRSVSDHYVVITTVNVMNDDDRTQITHITENRH